MNNMNVLWFLISVITLSSCQSKNQGKIIEIITEEINGTQDTISAPLGEEVVSSSFSLSNAIEKSLLDSYPDVLKEIKSNYLVLHNGDSIVYDDKKEKDYYELLDNSDIEDMFRIIYRIPTEAPEYLYDPGRSRSETLFKAMYGNSAKNVEKNLVSVDWFGQKVRFNSVNGAADSLRAVAKELALHPELKSYLKSSGTFYWRPVRGAKRMSAHSYGIAFDIGVDKSDYWQWKLGSNDEMKEVKYANRIPIELVKIFEKHGFIWGGSWYHYDTMHFEFRPELIRFAELVEKNNQ